MPLPETPRLLFRAHQPSDLDAYCALEADPDFRRYVGGKPRTRESAERRFRLTHLPNAGRDLALHATILKSKNRYVGYCGVYPHFGPRGPIPGEGTLAFYLAPDVWNQGLATEAGRAFLDHGFGPLGLKRIVASAETGNAASIRVLEKLGFTPTDVEHAGARTFQNFEIQ